MVVAIHVATLISVTAILAGPINVTITVSVRLIVVIIIPVRLLVVVVVVVVTIISVTFTIAISDYYCYFLVTFCDFFGSLRTCGDSGFWDFPCRFCRDSSRMLAAIYSVVFPS